MNIPWYKELILTHSIDEKGNVMPIKDTAGNARFDLQWELERYVDGLATKREVRRVELWQAIWGVLMIIISTASLAVLLYAVLE